jgi:ubiquinone/menaquinone biosynthesis C-methylase UbiE
MQSSMFTKTAQYYDLIYSFKNYGEEVAKLRTVIRNEHPTAHSILDVACGTAEHAKLLSVEFAVDGIDLEPGFVEIAQHKVPAGTFSVGDMRCFDLRKKYDVVQCLFSSIGYLTRGEDVVRALECFARHLADDGIIVVEPWFAPEDWRVGVPHMAPPVDHADIKICRMNVSEQEGSLSSFRLHYLIATSAGVEYIQEDHELALYTVDEMLQFFQRAGLKVAHDSKGISGRGLYVARLDHFRE